MKQLCIVSHGFVITLFRLFKQKQEEEWKKTRNDREEKGNLKHLAIFGINKETSGARNYLYASRNLWKGKENEDFSIEITWFECVVLYRSFLFVRPKANRRNLIHFQSNFYSFLIRSNLLDGHTPDAFNQEMHLLFQKVSQFTKQTLNMKS